MQENCVTVIGGVNIDIGGSSFGRLTPGDSNPGRVRISLGGVGRNIAHNMALMGLRVRLITAFGGDSNAQLVKDSCAQLGIDLSASITMPEQRTSTYLFIADEHGDMALALNDMEIYTLFTPEILGSRIDAVSSGGPVVIDTNLPGESIEYLAGHCSGPIFADPVSAAKCEKLRPVLGKLHTLKPNRLEAQVLSGVEIRDGESLREAAHELLQTGLARVFITLGADGVYAADHSTAAYLPKYPARMVNTTGCGDAFTAALVWAWQNGMSLVDSASAGLAAAAIAMESTETINSRMSARLLKNRMEENSHEQIS